MTNLDKICHKLMDSNHELKAKCALLEQENEQLKEKNNELKIIKNQYRGQKEYLLWVIERNCPSVLINAVKSSLMKINERVK